MQHGTTAGYVLAGGRSSRMGRDKSRLPWRGSTLLEHVAREVEAAAGSVTIVGGCRERDALRVVADEFPGFGPAGGIATALGDSAADWTLITACDMPGLTRQWLRSLIERADGQVLVPRTADGRVHPLASVWHRSAAQPVRDAVRQGVHAVRDVVGTLICRWVDIEDAGALSNVNTPEDWARLRE